MRVDFCEVEFSGDQKEHGAHELDQLVAVMRKDCISPSSPLHLTELLDLELVVLESKTAMVNLLEDAAATEGKPLRLRASEKLRGHLQND